EVERLTRHGVGAGWAWALALAASACSSGMAAPDGASTGTDGASMDTPSVGMCGGDVPAGQECTGLANLGAAVTPICKTGTAPTGTGGPIADGTYVLTSQDKYGSTCSSALALSETLMIAGDFVQLVLGDILAGTGSVRLTTQGNAIMFTRTCLHIDTDGAVLKDDVAMQTYTATSTTFTLFETNATTGVTNVWVFTRR